MTTEQNLAILSVDERMKAILTSRMDPARVAVWSPDHLPNAQWGARAFVLLVHVDHLHHLADQRPPALVVAVTEVEDPLEVDAALRRGADDVTTAAALPARLPILVNRAAARARLLDRTDALTKALAAARRSATLGELTRTLIHDLRDPLLVLSLDADLLARGLELVEVRAAEELAFRIDNMNNALDGMNERLQQLAAFCEADRSVGEGADPSQAAEQALGIVGGYLSNRATVLRSFGTRARVGTDPHELVQLLVEVLVCLARDLPADRPGNTLTVRTAVERDQVVITIEDNGGPTARSERRPPPEGPWLEEDGDGHGLWTASLLAERIGASLVLDLDETTGTVVRLLLPRMGAEGAVPSPRILLVEDEPLLRRSLLAGLPREWVIAEAADARQGRALLLDQTWDCVICDVMLPEGSAEGVYTEAVAQRPGLADRFVFITGGAYTAEARRFLGRVENVVLEKPFRIAELRRIVEAVLARNQARAAGAPPPLAPDVHQGHSA